MRLAEIWGLAAANWIGLLRILLYNDIFFWLIPFHNADGTFTPWLPATSYPANLISAEPIQSILQSTITRSLTLDPCHSDRWSYPDSPYPTQYRTLSTQHRIRCKPAQIFKEMLTVSSDLGEQADSSSSAATRSRGSPYWIPTIGLHCVGNSHFLIYYLSDEGYIFTIPQAPQLGLSELESFWDGTDVQSVIPPTFPLDLTTECSQ